MTGMDCSVIKPDRNNALYQEALRLRYQYFFHAFHLPFSILFDAQEIVSKHIALVQNDQLMAYGRLTNSKTGISQISQMLTRKAYRRQKLGTTVLQYMVKQARTDQAALIYLNARVEYIDFYRQAGFICRGKVFDSPTTKIAHQRMEILLTR